MYQPKSTTLILPIATLLAGVFHLNASVLSDNLYQPVSYTEQVDSSTSVAASFGTGSQASTLLDVGMLIRFEGQVNSTVSLYSDQAGQPGVSIGILSPVLPPSQSGLAVTTFTGQNLALAANSTYWIVAQASSGIWDWAYTESNSGSGAGFQHTWGLSLDGGSWFISNIEPMMMSVEDSTSTPEPASFALIGLGGLGVLIGKRFRRTFQR